jgi:translocation protein SEC63
LDPALETEKYQIVRETIKFQKGLMQIALAFNHFEPVRAAMETSQCLLQAIPVSGSPLLQLPGVDSALARELQIREKLPIKNLRDLLILDEKAQRKALESLDDKAFSQAINIAKQIPNLILSKVHFKGVPSLIISITNYSSWG